jgi:DNA gyrase inhibitor GyrI
MGMNGPRYSDVSLRELPPMHVVSYCAISATPEEDAAKVMAEWTAEQLLPSTLRSFGFDVEVTAEQQRAGLRGYELWIAVPPGTKPEDDMLERQFTGGLYAVMTIYDALDDPFAHIPAGWEYLHNWVTANPQYEPAEHQMLEEVIVVAGEDGAQHRHLVIYYPVAAIAVGVPS